MANHQETCKNINCFLPVLVSNDYADLTNTSSMLKLCQLINMLLLPPKQKLGTSKLTICEFINRLYLPKEIAVSKVEKFVDSLDQFITLPEDLLVFKFLIENVIIPLNLLLQKVPEEDNVIEDLIHEYLKVEGETGLDDVILMWHRVEQQWCMETERALIVAGFRILRETLDDLFQSKRITRLDADQSLTAFVQEFERRLVRGVRPGRAGRSLEDVTGVILDHFGIKNYADAPDHIKTVFEVDKILQLPDGWRIGVSCKRTLRERWKQAASLDLQTMDDEKIKSTWHVITYTSDLTVPKVEAIGESRGVVYIPEDDHFYISHSKEPDISEYMRPLSYFISDLHKEIADNS